MPGTCARSRGIWWGEVGATGRKNRSPPQLCRTHIEWSQWAPRQILGKGSCFPPGKGWGLFCLQCCSGGIWLSPPEEISATKETLPQNDQTPISTERRRLVGGSRPGEACKGTGSSPPLTPLLQGEKRRRSPCSSSCPFSRGALNQDRVSNPPGLSPDKQKYPPYVGLCSQEDPVGRDSTEQDRIKQLRKARWSRFSNKHTTSQ